MSIARTRRGGKIQSPSSNALVLVFVGPDGSGKSALARRLRADGILQGGPMNFRPRRVDRWLGKTNEVREAATAPHATRSLSPVAAVAKLLILSLDLVTLRWDFAQARRSGIRILVERYAYDLVADPARVGVGRLPTWMRRSAVAMAGPPDIVFCLSGDAHAMNRRKPELDVAEVQRQIEFWQDFRPPRTRMVSIDTTGSTLEDAAARIRHELGLAG